MCKISHKIRQISSLSILITAIRTFFNYRLQSKVPEQLYSPRFIPHSKIVVELLSVIVAFQQSPKMQETWTSAKSFLISHVIYSTSKASEVNECEVTNWPCSCKLRNILTFHPSYFLWTFHERNCTLLIDFCYMNFYK